MNATIGNRCGHDPKRPKLSPAQPIRKGKGGLPRILSLAAERAKAWYKHPAKCPPLDTPGRKTRSERREAYQIVIEAILSHLDLASLCLGTPTINNGFVDVDMQTLVRTSGISQRRIERALAGLKKAGLIQVKQPRKLNDQGDYVGLRAIRVVTTHFFEFVGLGPMLQRERARASAKLQKRAAKANRKLADMMTRLSGMWANTMPAVSDRQREDNTRAWNHRWAEYIMEGVDPPEAQRRTNRDLGYPADFSPGKALQKR